MNWKAYCHLMRLNKPIGILLLWFPTAWGLWLANPEDLSLGLILIFLMGTLIMRSAGCVINDIADRDFDKHVHRTKTRPLTAGAISLKEAFTLLAGLLFCALVLLLCLPSSCIIWAVGAVLITVIYPFCKRYINAPQLVLGMAFSMGIPMAYAASGRSLDQIAGLLWVLNFFWTVAYDTMYAMTDKADDLKIGIKSTAIYFASYDKFIVGLMLWAMHGLWLLLAYLLHFDAFFYVFWCLATLVIGLQQWLIKNRLPAYCFKAFLISAYYGALMWIALVLQINSVKIF